MTFKQTKTGGFIHAMAGCDDCGWRYDDWETAVKASYDHTKNTGHITWLETGYSFRRIPHKEQKK
jgi:hypothetical protein